MRQNPFRILKSLAYLHREDGKWLSHKLKKSIIFVVF